MNLYNIYMIRYDDERKCSLLYDTENEVMEIDMLPNEFLDLFCLYHGSSLKGRMDSFRFLANANRKIPVLVCKFRECIFFPTMSYKHNDCVWIQEKFVSKVTCLERGCRVHFLNGDSVYLRVSNRVIYKQLKRCRFFLNQIVTNVEVENLLHK